MIEKITQCITSSISVKQALIDDPVLLHTIELIVGAIVAALKDGHTVYFCGNGGSAADAQHLAAELLGKFYIDRESLSAEALSCNTSYITAVANDYSYDAIYARQIKGVGAAGDILIGLSTSGNSSNIVKAFEVAREKGIITIGFTGSSGGKLKPLSDYLLAVPSTDTPRIQEAHITLGHVICYLVEEIYFAPHNA